MMPADTQPTSPDMDLPAALRHAVDQALSDIAPADLTAASARLSQRYRAEIRDGRFHLQDELTALAYLATRLPATYAAIRAAMSMTTERVPGFSPQHQLDLGAGPGTAFWAAADCWPQLRSADLLEGSIAIRHQGEHLLKAAQETRDITWHALDLSRVTNDPIEDADYDLVTLCYVLDELAPEARHRLITWAWARCRGLILIAEPGTPAGWQRILAARDQLIASGGKIIAPCPHAHPCPLSTAKSDDNWCHFSRRVARSRLHRLAKQADVPWEDEKFIFIAAAQPKAGIVTAPTTNQAARVIAPPRGGGGPLHLQLCDPDGDRHERVLSKRNGALYKRARRVDWGDLLAMDVQEFQK